MKSEIHDSSEVFAAVAGRVAPQPKKSSSTNPTSAIHAVAKSLPTEPFIGIQKKKWHN